MSRTDWPKFCTLADAARLFEGEGVQVHRSNLSRFVASRNVPKVDGKVDPNALFDRYMSDFGRQTMAGQTGNAQPGLLQTPSAAFPAQPRPAGDDDPARDDPKRDLVRIQARAAQLALDEKLGRTVPAEEVAAGMAEAIADLRAAGLRTARDQAAKLVVELGLPAHKVGALVAGLKRYANLMQEAFAASTARLLEESSTPETPARARLDALIALDLQLRGEGGEEEPAAPAVKIEQVSEPTI